MAVVLGTNSGFVTVAPTTDPSGSSLPVVDGRSLVTKDTSPSTAVKIVEVGWYSRAATEDADYEIGIYAADGAVVPGEAGTLIHVSTGNPKGTTAGWKSVTGLDWSISPSTPYWIGVQLDDTSFTSQTWSETSGGAGVDTISLQTALPNPFGGGALSDADGMYAFYAVWEEAPPPSTFKPIVSMFT